MSSVSIRLVLVGIVLWVGYIAWPANSLRAGSSEGQSSPNEAARVRVELLDRTVVDGPWNNASVEMQTEMGSQSIRIGFIESIQFTQSSEAKASDTIFLTNHDRIFARVTSAIQVGDQTIPREKIRELRTQHANTGTLWAIFLGLLTLTALEIVLGIDNVIFLAIIAGKLPVEQQSKARQIGLGLALGTRLLLLASLSFIMSLTQPVFTLPELPFLHGLEAREISWRDVILLAGGMFLIGKSTYEIHHKLETAVEDHSGGSTKVAASFGAVLVQIAIIDIIFSLDSVITAVGMVQQLWVMIVAMVAAMFVMLYFAKAISDYVTRHPTLKILALAFLILIGVMLVAEGMGQHMDKGYIYFAMAFALTVELINIRLKSGKSDPVKLHRPALPTT